MAARRPARTSSRLIGSALGAGALVLACLVALPAGGAQAAGDPAVNAATTSLGAASTGRSLAGKQVVAQTSDAPPAPTAEQARYLVDADAGTLGDGPHGRTTTLAPAAPTGPATVDPATSNAATDLQFYRNSRLNAGGQRSAVGEPSTVISGKDAFATGNWYAAYTHSSHATPPTWTYLNPFSIFGTGFCCDQLTAYDVSRDRDYWLAQYGDHLTVANSAASNLSSWCSYNYSPATFGFGSGISFDFNKMAVSTNFLYIATNVFGGSGGSLVVRIPLQEQSTCSSLGFSYYYRTTEFSPAFVANAGDYMYWGTDWTTDLTLGSTFRVVKWGDTDASASFNNRTVAAFTFMFNGAGRCGSADGVVLNWCQRTDSRMSGNGYVAAPSKGTADSVVGWAVTAQQDANHPFPYIRRMYFRTSDLTYLGSSELWGNWTAHAYPSLAADYRGHVGMAYAWGGGTGTSHNYPGSGIMLDDDITPNQPWTYSYYQNGSGNPCLNTDNLRRWGDYLDIHPLYPAGYGFAASGFALNASAGGCGSNSNVAVANVVFGRARDVVAYQRWK